jgi:hypothetical protein
MNASDPVPCTTEGPQRSAIRPRRSAMSLHAKDRHKRAARIVGYALTADDPAIWWKTAAVLALRLTTLELASVAFAALRALDPEAREMVFNAATFDDGTRDPEPSGWNLEAMEDYRAARDCRSVRA